LAQSQLDGPRRHLEGQDISDEKVRDLFLRQNIPAASVNFQIHRAPNTKQTIMIEIWPVFGGYPLHLCDLKDGDPDFSHVRDALELR
jgi:hypothetical protein